MNWDQIGDVWKQFRGSARERWGKITDDDWDAIAGKKDQLVRRIQERWGGERRGGNAGQPVDACAQGIQARKSPVHAPLVCRLDKG